MNQGEVQAEKTNKGADTPSGTSGLAHSKFRSTCRAVVAGAALLVGAASYHHLEAEYFATAANRTVTNSTGTFRLDGVGLGPKANEALSQLTSSLQRTLQTLATSHDETKLLLEKKIAVRIIAEAQWGEDRGLDVRFKDGAIEIQVKVISRLLSSDDERLARFTREERMTAASCEIAPLIAGCWHQELARRSLEQSGAASRHLLTPELLGSSLATEQAVRLLVECQLTDDLRNEVQSTSMMPSSWIPGWRSERGHALPAEYLAEVLENSWGLRTIASRSPLSSVLEARLSTKFLPEGNSSSPYGAIQERVRASQALSQLAQERALPHLVRDLKIYNEYGSPPFDSSLRWRSIGFSGYRTDRNSLIADELAKGTSALSSVPSAVRDDVVLLTCSAVSASINIIESNKPKEWMGYELNEALTTVSTLTPLLKKLTDDPRATSTLREASAVLQGLSEEVLQKLATYRDESSYRAEANLKPALHNALTLLDTLPTPPEELSRLQAMAEPYLTPPADPREGLRAVLARTDGKLDASLAHLTETECAWLRILCADSISFPRETRGWERFSAPSPNSYRYLLGGDGVARLNPAAQVAVFSAFVSSWEGAPRRQVLTFDPLGSEKCALPWNSLEELSQILEVTDKLSPQEASLLVEGYFAIPVGERHAIPNISSNDFSSSDRRWLYLLGDCRENPGPLVLAIHSVAELSDQYKGVDVEALVEQRISPLIGGLTWGENVSVITSSNFDQLSWSYPLDDYEDNLLEAIRSDRTILQAHQSVVATHQPWMIRQSRPGLLVDAAVDSAIALKFVPPQIPPGVYQQDPQLHSARIQPVAGPSRALILYGDNLPRDLMMSFKSDANTWAATLSAAYGTESKILNLASEEELSDAMRWLTTGPTPASTSTSDVAIIVIGHGSSSQILDRPSPYSVSPNSMQAGSVSMKGYFSLTEPLLKKQVAQHTSAGTNSVTIVISSCHSGAFVR